MAACPQLAKADVADHDLGHPAQHPTTDAERSVDTGARPFVISATRPQLKRASSNIALVQSAPGTSDKISASISCRPSRVPE
jgi:hypothetical protein